MSRPAPPLLVTLSENPAEKIHWHLTQAQDWLNDAKQKFAAGNPIDLADSIRMARAEINDADNAMRSFFAKRERALKGKRGGAGK